MQYEDDFEVIDLTNECPEKHLVSVTNPADSLLERVWSAWRVRAELLRK
ncbi:hypothetical protein [Nocardia mangyaensis]|nr:hypothetical protein [Nocardia mangyaensis]MDO3651159.1 hypothetical protein [Nocardia mangyaensis]